MPRTRLDLLTALPRGGVGAELGVLRGDFSAEILLRNEPRRLWLVDTFAGWITSGDENGTHVTPVDMRDMANQVRARFAAWPHVEVVEAVSWQWLESRPAGSLDWLYLDTDHTYPTTALELRAARRAVRSGGLICGHDYCPVFPGLIQAVNEFSRELDLPLDIWGGDSFASYRMVNP